MNQLPPPVQPDPALEIASEALHVLRDNLQDLLHQYNRTLTQAVQSAYLQGYAKGLNEQDEVTLDPPRD